MPDGSGRLVDGAHVFPVRVYYEDTDAAGIVYYANYLRYAERARTELLRSLGTEHAAVRANDGMAFAVRRCEVDYAKPARLDDRLEVHTVVTRVGGASLEADQTVMCRGEAIVSIWVRLACVTGDGRPARLPQPLRQALEFQYRATNTEARGRTRENGE